MFIRMNVYMSFTVAQFSKRKLLILQEKVGIINVYENEKIRIRDMFERFTIGKTQISGSLTYSKVTAKFTLSKRLEAGSTSLEEDTPLSKMCVVNRL